MPRPPEIAFRCPDCGDEAVCGLDGRGRCPACGATPTLEIPEEMASGGMSSFCPACQGKQLYTQSDFNQKAGLLIVIVGAVLAPFTPYYSSLAVATLIDAALYRVLPHITICYRCQAHFRGFRRNPEHEAFDLHITEQYSTKS